MSDVATGRRLAPWRWIADVGRGWGWRDTGLGLLLGVASAVLGNELDFLFEHASRLMAVTAFHALQFGLPLVLTVKIANRAVDEGANRLIAYGLALLVAMTAGMVLIGPLMAPLLGPLLLITPEQSAQWTLNAIVRFALEASLYPAMGLACYALWRQEQRALAQAQAERERRARASQRLAAERLLALQARVEPQLLFDALGRIDALIERSPQAADASLAELIALLRAMLPSTIGSPTVGREFALLRAYAAVSTPGAPPWQTLPAAAEVEGARLAPMVLRPLLQCLGAATGGWRLAAERCGERLQLRIDGDAQAALPRARAALDDSQLRERLFAVHGPTASLELQAGTTLTIVFDLPFHHDDGADRRG